jgi:kynurenine formamidase
MTKIIDLTKPLNQGFRPYQDGEYHDPPFVISTWCETRIRGFWVSKLEMGTQSGTHIDAPAHFIEKAETIDQLDIQNCFGPYFLVRLGNPIESGESVPATGRYRGEPILLLLSPPSTALLSLTSFEALLSLGCKLWIVMGEVTLETSDPFHFHRRIAREGIYLVEDLDESAMDEIRPDGEIMALPLRLEGVSGSPCRVVLSMR